MKNYELIGKLSTLPAGAEVSFECICSADQVEVQDSDYMVTRKISEVYMEDERICLS